MGGLSCGGSCMKYILFLFNIIFFLCGAAILGVGIWAKVDDGFNDYLQIINFDDSNPYFEQAVWILIVVGALIFLIGFLGCCGSCQESSCLLIMYAVFLFMVIVIQIAGAALAIVFKDELGASFETEMATQANTMVTDDPTQPLTGAWYTMQYEFKCCGGNNYTDYQNSLFSNETGDEVPPTCCKLKNDNPEYPDALDYNQCLSEARGGSGGDDPQLYKEGCYQSLIDWVEENAYILFGVAFGIALIEIFGIVFACCVSSEIKKKSEYH